MNFPKRKSHLVFNKIEDQIVIIDFDSEKQFHQLNETAAFIWNYCDGKHDIVQIENLLFETYDTSKENIKNDLQNILKEFKDSGLLDC